MERHKVKLKKGEKAVIVHISVIKKLQMKKISHIMVTDQDGEWIHSFHVVPENIETKVAMKNDRKLFLNILPIPQRSIDKYRERCWWIK